MSYGCTATGLGTPVGGATSTFGSTSVSPYSSSLGTSAAGSWNFASTLDSNFWGGGGTSSSLFATGLSHIGQGVGELYQSGIFGSSSSFGSTDLSAGGYKPVGGGLPNLGQGTGSSMDLSAGGFKPVGDGLPKMGQGTGSSMDLSLGGFKPVGDGLPKVGQNTGMTANGGAQNDPLAGFRDMLKDYMPGAGGNTGAPAPAPAPTPFNPDDPLAAFRDMLKDYMPGAGGNTGAPAPGPLPVNNVANLVNRATQDARLTGPVTQIANDPVGNNLLKGALDAGLRGIEVANLPAGFWGQFLPATKQIQIAPATLGSQDLIRTLAHELVHAATVNNGNSLNEEGLADRLGKEIQQRVAGLAPGYVLGGNAYTGLPQDNGIASALRLLGINL